MGVAGAVSDGKDAHGSVMVEITGVAFGELGADAFGVGVAVPEAPVAHPSALLLAPLNPVSIGGIKSSPSSIRNSHAQPLVRRTFAPQCGQVSALLLISALHSLHFTSAIRSDAIKYRRVVAKIGQPWPCSSLTLPQSTELRLVALFRQHGIKGWRRGHLLPGKPDFVFPACRVGDKS